MFNTSVRINSVMCDMRMLNSRAYSNGQVHSHTFCCTCK